MTNIDEQKPSEIFGEKDKFFYICISNNNLTTIGYEKNDCFFDIDTYGSSSLHLWC